MLLLFKVYKNFEFACLLPKAFFSGQLFLKDQNFTWQRNQWRPIIAGFTYKGLILRWVFNEKLFSGAGEFYSNFYCITYFMPKLSFLGQIVSVKWQRFCYSRMKWSGTGSLYVNHFFTIPSLGKVMKMYIYLE